MAEFKVDNGFSKVNLQPLAYPDGASVRDMHCAFWAHVLYEEIDVPRQKVRNVISRENEE